VEKTPTGLTQILGSVQRSGQDFIGELLDSRGDPAPGLRAIVIAGARKLVSSRDHDQKMYRRPRQRLKMP
jgi:hypothetical protein